MHKMFLVLLLLTRTSAVGMLVKSRT